MSLQKFLSSGFCKAVSAFLFGVMILSACQETAQVVNNKALENKSVSASQVVSQSESAQAQTVTQGNNATLSTQEQALAKKLVKDKDFIALREMQQTLLFKMKIAIGHDKERLKEAMLKNDTKTYAELLNFSEAEYIEISNKIRTSVSNLQTKLASDMGTLEKFNKENPVAGCKTCETDLAKIDPSAIDSQLEKIAKARMVVNGEKIASISPDCPQDKLDRQNLGIIRCFLTFSACSIAAAVSVVGAWLAPICLASYIVCCLDVMCQFCGCPW